MPLLSAGQADREELRTLAIIQAEELTEIGVDRGKDANRASASTWVYGTTARTEKCVASHGRYTPHVPDFTPVIFDLVATADNTLSGDFDSHAVFACRLASTRTSGAPPFPRIVPT
jgi:hypothetical protein